MKLSKIITYSTLAAGLILSANTHASVWSAFGLTEAAQEASSNTESGNSWLKRLGSLYEATKSLAENTKWLSESINYVGRPETLQTLNDLSQSAKDLSTKGVKINAESLKQITLCSVGAAAALSGIGIITYTALKDDVKNAKNKYLAGAGLAALGIASVMCSNWLSK